MGLYVAVYGILFSSNLTRTINSLHLVEGWIERNNNVNHIHALFYSLLEDDEMPIVIEKEFTVECCVRGHHVYQVDWDAKIGSELKAIYETRPGALVQDKYAMALRFNDVTVGHVPKILSEITYFYL